ncbi:MAG: RidA family protein [Tissierella sp.]|nr:RidA family protein [Tissierella sp.]
MKFIYSDKIPTPKGHYSPAVVHNDIVYVSGQLPVAPDKESHEIGTIEEQFDQVIKNLKNVLEAAGSNLSHILRVTIYVSDIELWGRINAVYSDHFGEHRPARTIVPTRDLHYGYHVELDAIAAVIK